MTALCAAMACGIACAVSLSAMPVIIHFGPGQRVTSMTVTNHGHRSVTFQIRPFLWQQRNYKNVLTPTTKLLVSPPFGTLAPGARQVIRFGLEPSLNNQESSYRILLDEIPPPAPPGAGNLRILLRFSMPVFGEPMTPVTAHVLWRIVDDSGHFFLEGLNKGKSHLAIHNILLTDTNGHTLKVKGVGPGYILAGATRRWLIATPTPLIPGSVLHMSAGGRFRHINIRVEVEKPR